MLLLSPLQSTLFDLVASIWMDEAGLLHSTHSADAELISDANEVMSELPVQDINGRLFLLRDLVYERLYAFPERDKEATEASTIGYENCVSGGVTSNFFQRLHRHINREKNDPHRRLQPAQYYCK